MRREFSPAAAAAASMSSCSPALAIVCTFCREQMAGMIYCALFYDVTLKSLHWSPNSGETIRSDVTHSFRPSL